MTADFFVVAGNSFDLKRQLVEMHYFAGSFRYRKCPMIVSFGMCWMVLANGSVVMMMLLVSMC